jgi:hypothetical protein
LKNRLKVRNEIAVAMGVAWISRFDDLRMDEMLPGSKLRIVTRLVMKSARKIMLDLASARLWMSRFFIFICFAYHAIDCVGGKGFFIAPISLAIWLPAGWSTKLAHKQHEISIAGVMPKHEFCSA